MCGWLQLLLVLVCMLAFHTLTAFILVHWFSFANQKLHRKQKASEL